MKINNAENFGTAIRERRKELNYTQAFLAAFSGLSISFISDLENGKHTCELEKALYIANILGLNCILSERGK
ncbi:MAG: helix-turn-helix domain-containing protein [bacterium]|nr:helix-turn-helix domain-containing protein [bacterium]